MLGVASYSGHGARMRKIGSRGVLVRPRLQFGAFLEYLSEILRSVDFFLSDRNQFLQGGEKIPVAVPDVEVLAAASAGSTFGPDFGM